MAKPDPQPSLTFECVADTGFLRRKSVSYLPKGGQGPSYFVEFQDSSTMIVHDGADANAPVVGTVDLHQRSYKTNFTLKADSVTREPIQQSFDQSGVFRISYGCHIPAIKGDAQPRYKWKRTSDHGAGFLRGGQVLMDDAEGGREYAVYIGHSGWSGVEGELKILGSELGPEAVQQIVVTSAALQEILRRKRKRNNNMSSASASASASAAC